MPDLPEDDVLDDGAGVPRKAREPLLDQSEIDSATGYHPVSRPPEGSGVRAMLHAGAAPREPLPMLPVVFRELARRLSASLRGLFGSDVQVTLASLRTLRYGDFVEEVVLPAQIVTFRADAWEGRGIVALGPDFARLVLDRLLGAGRGVGGARVASRPFSAIETAILTRLVDAVLSEAGTAFGQVVPVTFRREGIDADPRLPEIAPPGESVVEATLALDLDGRMARLAIVLPYATLEPVRPELGRSFMGAKLGRDELWSGHLASEIWQAGLETEAVLHEAAFPLRQVLGLAVGDTLMFDMKPTDLVEVRCAGHPVTRGRIGRVEGRIAVQIVEPLRPRGSGRERVSP